MPASFRAALALAAAVAVALLVRIALIPLEGFKGDVAAFETWSRVLAAQGPLAIYGTNVDPRVDYAPGYLYVLWLVGLVRAAIDPHFSHAWEFRVLLKLPSVVADFEAAALGYAIVRRYASENVAVAAVTALLVGPVFWLDSAFWGQADTIAAALILGAILARLRDRAATAWLLLALAILVKPQALVLVPLFGVRDVVRGTTLGTLLRTGLAIAVVAYVTTVPFTTERSPLGVAGFLVGRYATGVAKAAHASEGAFNLYTIVGPFFSSDAATFAGVALHTWSIVLLLATLGAIAWAYAKAMHRSSDPRALDRAFVYAAALSLAALFFLGTRMHERYLLPGLACATLVAFDGFAVGGAVAALTLSFAVNCAVIVAGFTGGAHHPQVIVVGHVFSAVNLVALAVLAFAYARRTVAGAT